MHLLFYIPRECLERRVSTIDLWPDAKQAHQSVAMITGKILSSLALVQALESKRDELKLAQDQISFVVVDKLSGDMSVVVPDLSSELILCDQNWLR